MYLPGEYASLLFFKLILLQAESFHTVPGETMLILNKLLSGSLKTVQILGFLFIRDHRDL